MRAPSRCDQAPSGLGRGSSGGSERGVDDVLGLPQEVAQEAAPPPAAKRAPAPRNETQSAPGKKAPDSEREYMKRLNKDLDNLLGK